jgi:hypothetical protein
LLVGSPASLKTLGRSGARDSPANHQNVNRLIGPTFEKLSQRPDRDRSRPGIEDYRHRDVIDLLLPVA